MFELNGRTLHQFDLVRKWLVVDFNVFQATILAACIAGASAFSASPAMIRSRTNTGISGIEFDEYDVSKLDRPTGPTCPLFMYGCSAML